MHYIRKFSNNDEYRNYLFGDDSWRPLVAYILNNHTEQSSSDCPGKDKNISEDDWSTTPEENVPGVPSSKWLPGGGDNKRWVDYHNLGEHWIEVFNNGTMYFTRMEAPTGEVFDASVGEDGVLNIVAPTTYRPQAPGAPENWFTYDSSGVLNFWNYPEDLD